jgi:peroxiredoxin/uncharacterized membrane protein YphA (DoxX/SURF4 family)
MEIALLITRLLLAAVFAVAGVAKLADRAGSQQALTDFGVPAVLARPVGLLVPVTELGIAMALLPEVTAWWAAGIAFAVLLLFTAGIGFTLARGQQPKCHCFGQLSSARIGWPTLARNIVLAVSAAFVASEERKVVGLSAVNWVGTLTPSQATAIIAGSFALGLLALNAWFFVQILRQNGRVLLRIEALESGFGTAPFGSMPASPNQNVPAPSGSQLALGTSAPAFRLASLAEDEVVTLDDLRAAGLPVMLIFSDPNCGPCTALLPEIARWQIDHANALTIALISRGTVDTNRAKTAAHRLTNVLLQEDHEVADAYQAFGTPTAVLIRPDSTIASAPVAGSDAIRALVTSALNRPTAASAEPCPHCGQHHPEHVVAPSVPRGALMVGAPAPALQLPDLTGKVIDVADFRGRPTVLVFWNPNCGFCQRLLPELRAWDAYRTDEAPELLIISMGSVEANQDMTLRAPIFLDQSFAAGQAFGATGTPMAVLIDAQGMIASELVMGGSAIMALLKAQEQLVQ